MILSHKHKFIFIKGRKVAGTSAEIALSQICGPEDIITPITPSDERFRVGTPGEPRNYASTFYPPLLRRFVERRVVRAIKRDTRGELAALRLPRRRFVNHMDLKTVLRLVPAAKDYEIICVERSPYAKVMSLASWTDHRQDYRSSGVLPNEAGGIVEAVDRLILDGGLTRVFNLDQYRDLDGRITVKPWKSQSLASDMGRFFESRGLGPVPDVVTAKRGVNSDSLDAAKTLRPDQISAINQVFAEEFETFGWPMIR
jgi:hypothetical protein